MQGFAVKQPNMFSDHFPIGCWVKIPRNLLSRNHNNFQDQNKIKLPRQYTWNETSATKFTAAFHSNDILSWLQLFENTTFDLSSTGVENVTSQFTNIMDEAAKR